MVRFPKATAILMVAYHEGALLRKRFALSLKGTKAIRINMNVVTRTAHVPRDNFARRTVFVMRTVAVPLITQSRC